MSLAGFDPAEAYHLGDGGDSSAPGGSSLLGGSSAPGGSSLLGGSSAPGGSSSGFDPAEAYHLDYVEEEEEEEEEVSLAGFDPAEAYHLDYVEEEEEEEESFAGFDPQEVYDYGYVLKEGECFSDDDCPPGFVCSFSSGLDKGTCIKRGEIGIRIRGEIDSKTCPHCLSMIGRTGTIDSLPLPPYHKHCRCSYDYLS